MMHGLKLVKLKSYASKNNDQFSMIMSHESYNKKLNLILLLYIKVEII